MYITSIQWMIYAMRSEVATQYKNYFQSIRQVVRVVRHWLILYMYCKVYFFRRFLNRFPWGYQTLSRHKVPIRNLTRIAGNATALFPIAIGHKLDRRTK